MGQVGVVDAISAVRSLVAVTGVHFSMAIDGGESKGLEDECQRQLEASAVQYLQRRFVQFPVAFQTGELSREEHFVLHLHASCSAVQGLLVDQRVERTLASWGVNVRLVYHASNGDEMRQSCSCINRVYFG